MIENSRCDAEICGPAKSPGKAVVLNGVQWDNMLKHLHRGEQEAQVSEQERQYKQYLREQSTAMTKTWENSLEKIREQKEAEKLRVDKERVTDGENRYKKLKENDESKRMEQIAVAQDAIKRLKIGPRSLDSAYLLSDVLTTREQQCQMNAESLRNRKEKHLMEGRETIVQAEQWREEHKEKLLEKKRNTDNYKKQMFVHIQDEDARRKNLAKQTSELERQYRESSDMELQAQLEKERQVLQRKKEAQRQNALEAMKMAEERRLRTKMVDEIENKMISIFAKPNNRESIRKKNEKEAMVEKERLRSMIMKKLFTDYENKTQAEQKSLQNAVADLDNKFTALEQSKQDHVKKMKAARIQQHLDEVEMAKRHKQQQKDEAQWAITNRFKNTEVNIAYDRQRKAQYQRRAIAHRQMVEQQMEANQIRDAARDPLAFIKETDAEDDQNFFDYAAELIGEAESKKRPILPLLRAVDQYKKQNGLIPQQENLPHLQTNIDIGLSSSLSATCQANGGSRVIKYDVSELKKLKPPAEEGIAVCKKMPWKMSTWSNNNRVHQNYNN